MTSKVERNIPDRLQQMFDHVPLERKESNIRDYSRAFVGSNEQLGKM